MYFDVRSSQSPQATELHITASCPLGGAGPLGAEDLFGAIAETLRQRGLDYVEAGPPGWEHLVVLISEQPLLKAEVLARSSGNAPFVELDKDEIGELCARLNAQADAQWTAGVLSFLVG